MLPTKVPWIRPGVVVHEPEQPVDELLARFARAIRERGFSVAGYVQRNNLGAQDLGHGCARHIELEDLATGDILTLDAKDDEGDLIAVARLSDTASADLIVVSRFSAFEKGSGGMNQILARSAMGGTPVLTSIAGRCLHKWHGLVERGGSMIAPDIDSIWRWWGTDRLYRDLALGVPDEEVRCIVCGPRWLMVEAANGSGLAYLPRSPRDLLPHLPLFERMSLRQLAEMVHSWEPLHMAVGIAAINAHYNRYDLDTCSGNGIKAFRKEAGRVIVVGAFPGLSNILPDAVVIETDPRPGELPTIAMDTVVPGCSAIAVNSSTLINRRLPHILQLAEGARVALIGHATPMTPRLHDYGIEVLGGLLVHDPAGLGEAVRAGAQPRVFIQYGRHAHISGAGGRVQGCSSQMSTKTRHCQCRGHGP